MSKNLAIFDKNASTLPSFAKENAAGLGMENVSSGDMSTPQIKLMQAMSPELQEMDGVKAGQLLNSVTREVYDELYVVSLYYESRVPIFGKKDRSFIDSCDTVAEANTIVAGLPGNPDDYDISETKTQYCVALKVDDKGNVSADFPFVMYFKKTGIRVSNDWNSQINNIYGTQTARWAGIWKLSSTKKSNDRGTWFVPSVEFAGYVQDKALFDELTKTYQAVSGKKADEAA